MGIKYVCDDCGSETDTLTQLEICAETEIVVEPSQPQNMPRWDEPTKETKEEEEHPRYERELCNTCLKQNLAEYSYLINRLYRRGAK
jgi:hypothetical protein